MVHAHCTKTGTGTGSGTGTMGFYIMLCTVHTTQGQGQRTFFFYCVRSCPVQCIRAIRFVFHLWETAKLATISND